MIYELVLKILKGEDSNVDYGVVDGDDRFDDVETSARDDEDRFFRDENFPVEKSETDTGVQDF